MSSNRPRGPSNRPASRKSTNSSFISATHLERERRAAWVAAKQLRLVKAAQLREIGFPKSTIQGRVQGRRLFRMHHGVYASHPPPYSMEQRWLASVLACDPGALLSDWPAAIHLDIAPWRFPTRTHVTVPTGRGRTRRHIIVHQRSIDPRDAVVKGSIPVTRPELVLVHLSPALTPVDLERMLVAAQSLGMFDRGRFGDLIDERAGQPGIHKLRPLLAREPAIAKSDLELLMIPVLHAAGVPWPRFNHPIAVPERERPLVVDLYWPDLLLVVELDSQRWHADWARAEDDRERDQLLSLAGRMPHRFVRRRVRRDPRGTAQRLRRLVDRRRRELAAQGASAGVDMK